MDDTKKERSFLYRLWMDMAGDKKHQENNGGLAEEGGADDDLPEPGHMDIMDIVDRCCGDITKLHMEYLKNAGGGILPEHYKQELTAHFAEMVFYGQPPSKSSIEFLIQIQEQVDECLNNQRERGGERRDARVYINCTADRLLAWIFAFPPVNGGKGLNSELVRKALEQHQIAYGTDPLVIEQMANGSRYFELCLVAEGLPAEDGKDGSVIDHFPRLERSVCESSKDKFANYKQLSWLHYIDAGRLICDIIPPIPGIDGIDVTGGIVKGRIMKEIRMPDGYNTELIENGTKLVAKSDGTLYYENHKFHVKTVQKILPEVNLTVGNIITTGDLEINGDVFSGFIVKTTGDVKIHGMVGNSVIATDGSIEIDLGVRGCGEAVLDAGGDIRCGYIENCKVRCSGSIEARSIINCDVISDERIKGQTIIGGNVTALQEIKAETVGNAQHKRIELNLGFSQEDFLKKSELEKKIADLTAAMEPLKKNITFLQNGNRRTLRDWSMHEELSVGYAKMEEEKNEAEKRLREIREGIDQCSQCDLTASLIYPPAVINVRNDVVMVDQERSMLSIRHDNGSTKIT